VSGAGDAPAADGFAVRQRHLLALLKMRETAQEQPDSYLRAVAGSRGLRALREIDYFWKEYSFITRCPFTAGLMRQQGILREEVIQLIRQERLSPYIEEMARVFLERATAHADPLIATVARFELALAVTAEGDAGEYRIAWRQDPYYVLGCLVDDRHPDPDRERGRFVTVVSATIAERFRVEPVEPGS